MRARLRSSRKSRFPALTSAATITANNAASIRRYPQVHYEFVVGLKIGKPLSERVDFAAGLNELRTGRHQLFIIRSEYGLFLLCQDLGVARNYLGTGNTVWEQLIKIGASMNNIGVAV